VPLDEHSHASVGMSRESLNRLLREFVQHGWIRVLRNGFVVVDEVGLRRQVSPA
jgi:CRP-like cAMP-binding protein